MNNTLKNSNTYLSNKTQLLNLVWFFIFYFMYFRIRIFSIPASYLLSPIIVSLLAFNSPQKKINIKYSLPLYLFPFSLMTISFIQGINPFTNMSAFDLPLKIIIWSSIFTVSINYISNYKHLLSFLKVIIWANFSAIVISIFSSLTNNIQLGTRFYYWILDRHTLNPNYVAFDLQLCIFFIWLIIIIEKKLNIDNKKIYIPLIFIFSFDILWTQSRTAIFAPLILLIFTFLKNLFFNLKFKLKIRYKKTQVFLTFLTATIASYFLLFSKDVNLIFQSFIERFESSLGSELLSYEMIGGRDILWEAAFNSIKDKLFFGTGTYGLRYVSSGDLATMLHNSLLEIFVGYGLAGILSLGICIYFFVKILNIKSFQNEFKPLFYLFFLILLWSITINIESARSVWFFLIILASISRINFLEKSTN